METAQTPGAAIACLENGETRWIVGVGEREDGVPADLLTVWNVASLTKPVTDQVLLELAAADRLDLDAPTAAHYADPDLADPDLAGAPELDALTEGYTYAAGDAVTGAGHRKRGGGAEQSGQWRRADRPCGRAPGFRTRRRRRRAAHAGRVRAGAGIHLACSSDQKKPRGADRGAFLFRR
ncbi:MAG: serine hydrolase [Oceanicaulis sp.]